MSDSSDPKRAARADDDAQHTAVSPVSLVPTGLVAVSSATYEAAPFPILAAGPAPDAGESDAAVRTVSFAGLARTLSTAEDGQSLTNCL